MAKASIETISALRNTAGRLEASNQYQWGHMGSCNCGFLAQQIGHLTKDEIHSKAMQRYGDWNEQLIDYCPSSGLPMDDLIEAMVMAGFSIEDLKHLERLSDPRILNSMPPAQRYLRHNIKIDVIKYMRAWATLLETELLERIGIRELERIESDVQREVIQ